MATKSIQRCVRCGVDYDSAPFLFGAPCIDCQESGDIEEPEFGWLKPIELHRRQEAEFTRVRDGLVRKLYSEGLNDREIAERMGYTGRNVWGIRQKLGLPMQPVVNTFDPIVENQRLKLKEAVRKYDYAERHTVGNVSRKDHAAWRLANGWPEETALWQEQSMREAGLDVHRN